MSGPVHPRALLARWGLRPRKKYGQNFLVDASASRKIAALCAGEPTRRILEVGAGTGALTRALLECDLEVTAIEIDAELVAALQSLPELQAARIVHADALQFDDAAWAQGRPWLAAGNLPYNVATPLIVHWVEMDGGPDAIVAMVQRDVADRLTASPGTGAYGSLSVAVQYAMHVERAFVLKPAAFYPSPNVDSAVVRLTRRAEPTVRPRDLPLFRKVVRGAFAYRRKTLANSLALALDLPHATVAAAVTAAGIPPEQRGERLDLQDFARLADALAAG